MNYEKLADLLYKDTKYTPSELEKKYPKRNLPKTALVTRFAPSPTGYLHIGNFFSAFLDWEIARMSKGRFFFRLEDTDKKREIEGSGLVAIKILNDYGIVPDEGLQPDGSFKGNYGPYIQSQRLEIYNTYAKELVRQGRAFPCFCEKTESIEEIKQNRQKQLESNDDIVEKDPCRNLSLKEIEEKLKQGKHFALRLRSSGEKGEKIITEDLIRGKRELSANAKDIILMKNNGIPPYAFAHAVDDHLMRTSVVVRGEEWYVSYPAHIELFKALGFDKVSYIHTPIICKTDEKTGNKRKLSKRKDPEADMRYFSKKGYPKNALLEYLLTLANSNFEIWRIKNPDLSYLDFPFSIEKIGSSNPMFDLVKLNDISKNYIAKLSANAIYDNLLKYTKEYDKKFYNVLTNKKDYALKVLSIDRECKKPRKDFATWSDFKKFFDFMFGFKKFETKEDYDLNNINENDILEVLTVYKTIFSEKDDKNEWFEKIKNMANELGYATNNKLYKENPQNYKGNVATVCNFIRIALTGKQNSPDIYTISQILGETKTKQQFEKLENILKK